MAFLRQQPDIVAVYLFGSQAGGRVHLGSDVDIAILLDEEAMPPSTDWTSPLLNRRLELIAAVEDFASCDVDVITLNNAPPLLCFEVLSKGRLLVEGNREDRVEFEVRTGQIYNDLEPMYEFFDHALRHELKEARFGGYG